MYTSNDTRTVRPIYSERQRKIIMRKAHERRENIKGIMSCVIFIAIWIAAAWVDGGQPF